MEDYWRRRPPNSGGKKASPHPNKTKQPFPTESTVFWCNSAFVSDECSSVGSNSISSSSFPKKKAVKSTVHMSEEEIKIREELAMEIEKELEREIMEGILVLVRRLSNLKAKQIYQSLYPGTDRPRCIDSSSADHSPTFYGYSCSNGKGMKMKESIPRR